MKGDFSVLMSVYYKENPEYMRMALDSVLVNQTLKPSEVILVEDGSLTDELNEVVFEYQKRFPNVFKPVLLMKNQGLGAALNYGVDACSYDIIMRMDTDDISCPDRFLIQYDYMMQHPDVSVVSGTIGEFEKSPDEELRLKTLPLSYEDVREYAKFRNPVNHMAACLRRKDIIAVGNYQPKALLEDHYLWARLLINGKKIENVPDLLVKARIGNGFYDRRGSKRYTEGWKQLQNYMYKNKYINFLERERNMIGMFVMTNCPKWFRVFLYNKILRRK